MPGPRRLVDWPWVVLRIECEPCRYGAAYRIVRLAERYGAEADLAGLLERVRAKCRLIDRGHRRRQPVMACAIRYRVPPGGPLPDGVSAREERPGDPWPPRPRRLKSEPSRSTIGDLRHQGITHVDLHCYGINRDGVTCHNTDTVALDALKLPDDAPYDDIARRGWRCRKCGHRRPGVMPCWPSPSEAHARRMSNGAARMHEVNGILVPRHSETPQPAPEIPAVPSMPDRSLYDVVEDDDGTFAVVWAATGRVVEWDGRAQRGLTLDQADDAADHLEALDRIAERRGRGKLDA